MLSPPLNLTPGQHGAQSAPRGQPVKFKRWLTDRHPRRFRVSDPTSARTDTRGFGARP